MSLGETRSQTANFFGGPDHVIRIEDSRLPKQLLNGGMKEGERSVVGQNKRHKDHVKNIAGKCDIDSDSLEVLASNRVEWRIVCHGGVECIEEMR